MVLGLSTSSVHIFLASLHSSSSEIFPVWVSCALLLYWPLWSQRKHFSQQSLRDKQRDNYRYRTKMLHWGNSSFLKFLFVSFSGKDYPFRSQDHHVEGKTEAPHTELYEASFMKVTVELQEATKLAQKCIFSTTFSIVPWGIFWQGEKIEWTLRKEIRSEGTSRCMLLFAEDICS